MVSTVIETGLRWGELIALRPRHIDFLRRTLTVEETIVEVPKKISPTGDRMIFKPYPKDNEPRTFGVRPGWLEEVAEHIRVLGSAGTSSCSAPRSERRSHATPSAPGSGCPPSRPRVSTSGVRIHDLRHAHASWLLAGGADLKGVMDRMGHAQIQTTQKYLHTLPDTDQKNLDALTRIAGQVHRKPGGDRVSRVSRGRRRRMWPQAEATRHNREGRSRGSTGCDRSSPIGRSPDAEQLVDLRSADVEEDGNFSHAIQETIFQGIHLPSDVGTSCPLP